MTDAAGLVMALKAERTWEAVAVLLKKSGATGTRATWWKIARGQQAASLEQTNALRAANGLPLLPPPPSQVVAASGVQRVVVYHDDADVALLLNVRGKMPKRLTVQLSEVSLSEGEIDTVPVVTTVTRPRRREDRIGLTPRRSTGERLRRIKIRHGLTWDALLEMAADLLDEDCPYIEEGSEQ